MRLEEELTEIRAPITKSLNRREVVAEEKKSLENLYKQKQGVSARRKGSPPTIYKVMSEQQLDKKINTIAIWTSWETTELTLSLSHSQLLQLSSMGHKF